MSGMSKGERIAHGLGFVALVYAPIAGFLLAAHKHDWLSLGSAGWVIPVVAPFVIACMLVALFVGGIVLTLIGYCIWGNLMSFVNGEDWFRREH